MKNYHIIRVRYIGPSNYRGARVKLTSERFEQSIIIPFDYAARSGTDMAAAELERRGFHLIGTGEGKRDDYIISDTFEPLKPKSV